MSNNETRMFNHPRCSNTSPVLPVLARSTKIRLTRRLFSRSIAALRPSIPVIFNKARLMCHLHSRRIPLQSLSNLVNHNMKIRCTWRRLNRSTTWSSLSIQTNFTNANLRRRRRNSTTHLILSTPVNSSKAHRQWRRRSRNHPFPTRLIPASCYKLSRTYHRLNSNVPYPTRLTRVSSTTDSTREQRLNNNDRWQM